MPRTQEWFGRGKFKLTVDDRKEVNRLYDEEKYTLQEIANVFGVSTTAIWKIRYEFKQQHQEAL